VGYFSLAPFIAAKPFKQLYKPIFIFRLFFFFAFYIVAVAATFPQLFLYRPRVKGLRRVEAGCRVF